MNFEDIEIEVGRQAVVTLANATITIRRAEQGGSVLTVASQGNISGSPQEMATLGVLQENAFEGEDRSIQAIVDRFDNEQFGNYGRSPRIEITVLNNSITGFASSEIDTGKDKVLIAPRYGGALQERKITRIIEQDAGIVKFEVR